MSDYVPMKTNRERRNEKVKGIAKAAGVGVVKALGDAADRLIPQGRDEIANALFNGNAYWPGEHPMPLPGGQEAQQSQITESPGSAAIAYQGTGDSPNDPYLSGQGYPPKPPDMPGGPGGLYLSDSGSPTSSRIPPSGGPERPVDPYMTGRGYQPEPPDGNAMHSLSSYAEQINESRNRGKEDRGERSR